MTSELLNLEKFSDSFNEKLCISLVKADSEEEVAEILKPFIDDLSLWQPLGDREGNFNTIGNQQSNAVAALVENVVNSGDAVLIDECLKEGVSDLTSEKAPQSMSIAMEKYFGMKEGDPTSISSEERKKLSEKIGLVATGEKKYPNISCFDKGIGQNPSKFKKSFLSLPGSEKVTSKSGIPFVQGLFNMGSTGVLPFCGKPKNNFHFKLVVSKRDPQLADADGKWGFTIIRRIPPTKKHTSSTYVYLAPNNEILTFKTKSLPILPGKYPKAYEQSLEWGSYIKLYNYQLPQPSIIVLELLYELGHQLFRPAVPVKMYERRLGFETSHTLTNIMHGDQVRLYENQNKIEDDFPQTFPIDIPDIGILKVTIYVLKKTDKKQTFLGTGGAHRVLFTYNGQMHDSKTQDFLSSEKVNLSYLAEDMLVVVNCDEVDDEAREDLFMPSRDRTRVNETRKEVERQLHELLANHDGLKQLYELRRAQALKDVKANKKLIKVLANKLAKRSSAFSKLFDLGDEIEEPYDFDWKKVKNEKYETGEFPTFFRIKDGKDVFEVQQNKSIIIPIENDAPNDYFSRSKNKGYGPFITPRKFNYHFTLWNGVLKLNLKPRKIQDVNSKIPVSVVIKDKKNEKTYEIKFTLKTIPRKQPPPPPPKINWEPAKVFSFNDIVHWNGSTWKSIQDNNIDHQPDISPEWWSKQERKSTKDYGRDKIEKEGGKPQPMRSLPTPKMLYKNEPEWNNHFNDDGDGVHIIPNGESFDFFINGSNIHYQEEQRLAKSEGEIQLLKEQFQWGLTIQCLSMIYEIKEVDKEIENTEIAKIVKLSSRGLAMSLIPTIKELGKNILR